MQIFDDENRVTAVNRYIVEKSILWSPGTLKTYCEHLLQFLRWLFNLGAVVEDCDEHTISIFAEFLCSVRNPELKWQTIDKRVRVAAAFLKWCAKEELILIPAESLTNTPALVRGSFARGTHPRRPMKVPTKWVALPDALRFVKYLEENGASAHGVRNGLMGRLMLECGLRIGECAGFLLDELPLVEERHEFSATLITGKGRKQRVVLIPTRLLRELHGYVHNERARVQERLKKHGKKRGNAPLFLTQFGNSPSSGYIQRIFREAGAALKLQISPHTLRHTFGTYHYKFNKDIYALQDVMGHADAKTTSFFYVHAVQLSGYTPQYIELLDQLDGYGGQ